MLFDCFVHCGCIPWTCREREAEELDSPVPEDWRRCSLFGLEESRFGESEGGDKLSGLPGNKRSVNTVEIQ